MELELTEQQRKVSYAILLVLWPVMIYNLVMPFQLHVLQQALYWTAIAISITHAVEIFLFYPRLPATTNKVLGIVLIFFFGIVYGSNLPKDE